MASRVRNLMAESISLLARAMAETPTSDALCRAKTIPEDDVVAAVDAFMADPTRATAFPMGDSYRLDLVAAVAASKFARETVISPDAAEHLKRAAVLTAILLARPSKT